MVGSVGEYIGGHRVHGTLIANPFKPQRSFGEARLEPELAQGIFTFEGND